MATMTNERNNYLFEAQTKERYLNELITNGTITEESAKTYIRIFKVTYKLEDELGKDLNEFTFSELEDVLRDFKANNRHTLISYASIISSYLNWSVEKGYTDTNELSVLKPADFVDYLDNQERYFTNKQLTRWEQNFANEQDAVLNRLLFIGAGGKQMSELRNLTIHDVDFENRTIRLVNTIKADENTGKPIKFTERFLKIEDDDDVTLELIKGAYEQTYYKKSNGDMASTSAMRTFSELVKNDYIIRASITRTENHDKPVDKHVIFRRIKMMGKLNKIPNYTTKYIRRSGMIYFAHKLIGNEDITIADIKMVADRFDVKSYHNLEGVLTMENIRETYPLD
ncbi:phage lytic cycle repressor MrpR family protein [Priestia megaterium]|uniref:phage lytic cycle repressor MrpR family protein n=1 Tax=Priestia megaterium TaxID=1404 RepID=UPI000BFB8901|nr:hypothetical protein [Priestia megaterium]PGO60627.1 hypothetical protein CN981_08745 [Priestia megaterium]